LRDGDNTVPLDPGLRIRDVARRAVRELRQSVFDPAPGFVRRQGSDGDNVMRIASS
jgi:hypothetical protein